MLMQADNGNDKVDRGVVKRFFDKEDFTHISGSARKWCHTFVDAGGSLLGSKMTFAERMSFMRFLEAVVMMLVYILGGLIEDSDDTDERDFLEGLEGDLGRFSIILAHKRMLYD